MRPAALGDQAADLVALVADVDRRGSSPGPRSGGRPRSKTSCWDSHSPPRVNQNESTSGRSKRSQTRIAPGTSISAGRGPCARPPGRGSRRPRSRPGRCWRRPPAHRGRPAPRTARAAGRPRCPRPARRCPRCEIVLTPATAMSAMKTRPTISGVDRGRRGAAARGRDLPPGPPPLPERRARHRATGHQVAPGPTGPRAGRRGGRERPGSSPCRHPRPGPAEAQPEALLGPDHRRGQHQQHAEPARPARSATVTRPKSRAACGCRSGGQRAREARDRRDPRGEHRGAGAHVGAAQRLADRAARLPLPLVARREDHAELGRDRDHQRAEGGRHRVERDAHRGDQQRRPAGRQHDRDQRHERAARPSGRARAAPARPRRARPAAASSGCGRDRRSPRRRSPAGPPGRPRCPRAAPGHRAGRSARGCPRSGSAGRRAAAPGCRRRCWRCRRSAPGQLRHAVTHDLREVGRHRPRCSASACSLRSADAAAPPEEVGERDRRADVRGLAARARRRRSRGAPAPAAWKSVIQAITSGSVRSSERTITFTSPETPVSSCELVHVPERGQVARRQVADVGDDLGLGARDPAADRQHAGRPRAPGRAGRSRPRASAVAAGRAGGGRRSRATGRGRRPARRRRARRRGAATPPGRAAAKPAVAASANASATPATSSSPKERTIGIGESSAAPRSPAAVATQAAPITGPPPRGGRRGGARRGPAPSARASLKRAWNWIA